MKSFKQFMLEKAEYAVVKYKDKDGVYRTPDKLKTNRKVLHNVKYRKKND